MNSERFNALGCGGENQVLRAQRLNPDRFTNGIAPRAIRTRTQQCNGIPLNLLRYHAYDGTNGHSLHEGTSDPNLPGVIGQVHCNGSEAGRVAGKARAFQDAIRKHRPADELATPCLTLGVVNARVDGVIDTQKQHPAVGVGQSSKDPKRIRQKSAQ